MTKSELRSMIREILKEELSKTNNEHLAEAIARRTITRDEIKNISISADEFAVMTDLDDDASFCSYDSNYDEVWTENFFEELDSDSVFHTFGEAANLALLCAKKCYDYDFFIVSFKGDVYQPEAHISCKINGYNLFSTYDETTDTWSDRLKIRG